MAATPSPPSEAALARFLAEASGARGVEIDHVELLPGGAIQQNWGFEGEFAGAALAGCHTLVLRTDADTGIPSSLGRVEEFAVLKAAHAAGVRVPEPLFACADPGVIGKPFFVMRRLPGIAQGRFITTDPTLEPALPNIAARLGAELARIQTIRPPRADLAFLPSSEASGPEAQIAGFRAYLDRHPQPRPVLEWAIRWLEMHLPPVLPPVLCHRDFRTGNYLVHGTELTGILDWEFAGWGDPDEDIGWFCCKGWRFARLDREAGGIAERAVFYQGYETASGRRLDPDRVFFWEAFANLRWALIALQQSDRCLIGGARELSTAIIGRRAGECELELLMLLDPDGVVGRKSGAHSAKDAGAPRESADCAALIRPTSLPSSSHVLRDQPTGFDLLDLGRELLLDELLPLLPQARHRDLHFLATAIAIARREAEAGDAPVEKISCSLANFYGEPRSHPVVPAKAGTHPSAFRAVTEMDPGLRRDDGEGAVKKAAQEQEERGLISRFAADLRNGAFETSGPREREARAILWAMTIARLRESNPNFLAANGFGE